MPDFRLIGELVRQARQAAGLSQKQLGQEAGRISQAAVSKAERGDTAQSKFLPQLLTRLRLDLKLLSDDPPAEALELPNVRAPLMNAIPDERNFPIFSAAEGGVPDQINVSDAPIDYQLRPTILAKARGSYGILIAGTSMEPAFRPGDTALVWPGLPIVPDETYIFYAEREGSKRATIKHLRQHTATEWLVTQYNPKKDLALSRKEWQWAHRVVAKRMRG